MDWEGKVESPKLVCSASGRAIAAGEPFFSALVFRDGRFARLDFAADAWDGVDKAGLLSWWRTRPAAADRRVARIDAEALLGIFHALKDATERPQQCFLYVVVLFLARARKLRFRGTRREGERSWLLVEDRADGTVWKVRDPAMTPAEEQAVQDNLIEVVEVGVAGLPSGGPGG